MFIVALAAVSAGLWGVGHGTVRSFENLAATDIRSKLAGNQIEVSVKSKLNGVFGGALGDLREVLIWARDFSTDGLPLFCEPGRSKRGKIGTLRLNLKEFSLSGLKVQSLEASIPGCRFDYALAVSKRQIRLSQSGVGTGSVTLREKDLEAFILQKFREVKKVSVKLTPGLALVEGYGEFLIIQTNFRVEAILNSPDGKTLMLQANRILFDGVLAEPQAARVILETLNPVVDLPKDLGLLDAVHVEHVSIGNGTLTATANTKIPVNPNIP